MKELPSSQLLDCFLNRLLLRGMKALAGTSTCSLLRLSQLNRELLISEPNAESSWLPTCCPREPSRAELTVAQAGGSKSQAPVPCCTKYLPVLCSPVHLLWEWQITPPHSFSTESQLAACQHHLNFLLQKIFWSLSKSASQSVCLSVSREKKMPQKKNDYDNF